MAWVYLVRNTQRKCYIGMTTDLDNRLRDHNSGKSKWTKNLGPWELIWSHRCPTIGEARKLEARLKRQHGGSGLKTLLEKMIDSGP